METPGYAGVIDSTKPREERDFKEIYPDLDESSQLNVFVLKDETTNSNIPKINSEEESKTRDNVQYKKPSFRAVPKSSIVPHLPKFTKMTMDYGFQDPSKQVRKQSKTLTRPYSLSLNEDIEEVTQKKRRLVEYDMDEQDMLYLTYRKEQVKNSIKITPEVFEIMITILETEWNRLEVKLSAKNTSSSISGGMLKLVNDVKYGDDDGIVQGSFVEQKCAICNDSDCENSNAIVFCDGCDIAVHQECYGVAFIPEGQWLCRKCMINKNREVHCIFCPSTTGAFKQLDSSLWSHVVCALWITELYFANPIYMEPIEGVDLIPKNRWKLSCYICKQKGGACIQCHNRNCFQAYHVTCAKRAGLYMNLTKGVQGAITNKGSLRTYCDKHGPGHWDQDATLQGIAKTRLYFRDLKILNDRNAKILKRQETENKLNVFKWKTENDTPIAPHSFANILFEKLIEMKLDTYNPHFSSDTQSSMIKDLGIIPNQSKEMKRQELRQISYDLCRYWCLKRESKNGAPLIRKNNNMELSSIIYGSNELDEINNKKEFGKILIDDLSKVINLVENVVEREETTREINNLDMNMIDSVYFTMGQIIELEYVKFTNMDTTKLLNGYTFKSNMNQQTWNEISKKVFNYEYESISTFVKECQEFCTSIFNENKSIAGIHRLAKKIIRELQATNWEMIELKIKTDFENGNLQVPFVEVDGGDIKFKTKFIREELEEEGLSEVESLNEADESEIQKFYQ
ncbi:nuA3 HAT complex component Nto1p [[Candida] anglica]